MTRLSLQTLLRQAALGASLLVLLSACGGTNPPPPTAPQAPEASDSALAPGAKDPDHHEFEATLDVPFVSAEASGARDITVHFAYPGATTEQTFAWQLELRDTAGRTLQQWAGGTLYQGHPVSAQVRWPGRVGSQAALPDGSYTVHLQARAPGHEPVEQAWDILVGRPERPDRKSVV